MPRRTDGPLNRRLIGVGVVLLIVFTLLAYGSVLKNDFVNYDDEVYIVQNAPVLSGPVSATLRWAMTATVNSNWHPVTRISHSVDVHLFGLNSAGHHLHSVLLHAMNAVLLFLLLSYATGSANKSFVVAALFALHPLNVESVAWAAERKTVLSACFFFLALAAYDRYARRPRWTWFLAVAGMFAIGLASKPMILTLPCVLLLLDVWPMRRFEGWSEPGVYPQYQWNKLLAEKAPLLLLSLASAIVTVAVQKEAMNPILLRDRGGKCADFVCALHREGLLAEPPGGVLPHGTARILVGCCLIRCIDLCLGVVLESTETAALVGCGMVVLPWHVTSSDRADPGWRASHGRPVSV